jgi:hypothetical protein
MRVGADQRVRIGTGLSFPVARANKNYARQVLEIHLMNNAHIGRDDCHVAETRLSPAQEGVTFAIALELQLSIDLERLGTAEFIDLNGVVDY